MERLIDELTILLVAAGLTVVSAVVDMRSSGAVALGLFVAVLLALAKPSVRSVIESGGLSLLRPDTYIGLDLMAASRRGDKQADAELRRRMEIIRRMATVTSRARPKWLEILRSGGLSILAGEQDADPQRKGDRS